MPKETFFNLSEEKQENVMRTAIREFSEYGFEKGNIGNIAKNAGVAKGSMYQYFENKHELFIYAVKWATETLLNKYQKQLLPESKEINIFDYLYETSKATMKQMMDERDLVIFVQDVFLGKHKGVMDESVEYMVNLSEKYTLQLIRHGKENGYIRTDIDDKYLCIFITAVSLKFKEHMMSSARALGEDIIDEPFETYENEIKVLIELLKNGMMGGTK